MITGIYFVTDADAPAPVPDQVRAALAAGIRTIQLRDKEATDAALIAQANVLQSLIRAAGGQFIINDRIDVALSVGADGLHVGQGDGDIGAIRTRIGPDMHLGLSIGHPDQIAAIPPGCVDYIGAGPVRATATKPDHAPAIGFDGLARIAALAPCPTVAIGGLGLPDIAQVRDNGCAGAAVVSAISRQPDMHRAAGDLVTAWSQT